MALVATPTKDEIAKPLLLLGVKRGAWRVHDPDAESANDTYVRMRMDVLRRDHFSCQYCSFAVHGEANAAPHTLAASGYLEIHHKNDNHRDNRFENLLTVCPYCHSVFHVGNAGARNTVNVIWFPWLSQEQINLMCNVAAVSIAREDEYAVQATGMLKVLERYRGQVDEILGPAVRDGANLGSALMSLAHTHPQLYAQRARLLSNIRLIPRREMYQAAIAYWAKNAWRPSAQYHAVFEQWNQAA